MSATLNWPRESNGGACQSSEMAAMLNSLSLSTVSNIMIGRGIVCIYVYMYVCMM